MRYASRMMISMSSNATSWIGTGCSIELPSTDCSSCGIESMSLISPHERASTSRWTLKYTPSTCVGVVHSSWIRRWMTNQEHEIPVFEPKLFVLVDLGCCVIWHGRKTDREVKQVNGNEGVEGSGLEMQVHAERRRYLSSERRAILGPGQHRLTARGSRANDATSNLPRG